MADFLYYRAGKRKGNRVTLSECKEWGLGYAFDADPQSNEVDCPKMGGKGFVFGNEKNLDGKVVGIYWGEQEWVKIPGSDTYVGVYKDARPTPKDLIRPRHLGGYELILADGNTWYVPIVRQFIEGQDQPESALPCYLTLDEDGNEVRGEVVDVYRHLWDATEPLASALMSEERGKGEEIDVDTWALARILLQANYRLDIGEINLLPLFSEEVQPLLVGLLAIQYTVFLDRQKKTESTVTPDGELTSAGEAA